MKHTMKRLRVVPRGATFFVNGEAATRGVAAVAQNVREIEDALQVTGVPTVTGQMVAAGERLLLVDGEGRCITVDDDGVVRCDGTDVTTAGGTVLSAHVVGGFVVVVSDTGTTVLRHDGTRYVAMDASGAVPQLQLDAIETQSHTATLDACTFAEAYSQWGGRLNEQDVSTLTRQLRAAWTSLTAQIEASGRYCAPVTARYGVRLWDDSYLWMSDGVTLGEACLSNAAYVTREVATGGGFTGVEQGRLAMTSFRVGVSVLSGVAAEWLPLVKAVDVLVSAPAAVVQTAGALDYRCVIDTTAGRDYRLQERLTPQPEAQVRHTLATTDVHVVAVSVDVAALAEHHYVAPNVAVSAEVPVPGVECAALQREVVGATMSVDECDAVGEQQRMTDVRCAVATGGRLYCSDAGGRIAATMPGNPLVMAWTHQVAGSAPMALAAVSRPLYAGGFGRYPLYLFCGDGIYALPQSAGSGAAGEVRLVSRAVMDATVRPTEGDGDVYFVDRHSRLCRLRASAVTVVARDVAAMALAWSSRYGELWVARRDAYPLVVMAGDRTSVRTVDGVQAMSDAVHSVIVDSVGRVLDLNDEQAASMAIAYRSQPITVDDVPRGVLWNAYATGARLRLELLGERGVSCHGMMLGALTVRGEVAAPLPLRVAATPVRTVRLAVNGVATTGDVLLPMIITCGHE